MLTSTNDIWSLTVTRAAQLNRLKLNQAMNRLATAQRINSAADDPAGLIASLNMDATLAALDAQTTANQRAINMANTADAALGQISDMLTEAKSLATANANEAGLSDEEKAANQLEINSILSSIDRLASSTRFADTKLLDGDATLSASGQKLKIDSAHTSKIGNTTIDGDDYTLSDIGSGQSLDTTGDDSEQSLEVINASISDIATARGRIGAFSSHTLNPRLNQLAAARENLINTVSLIRDAEYASEASALIREQILEKNSVLMLKAGYGSTGSVLSLLA